MGKDMLESFPREDIQRYCQGKISFHGNIQRDALFAEQIVLRYSCKTCHFLCGNCFVITPTQKDSSMFFTEQSATPSWNPSPRQLDHSAEILPFIESSQESSTPTSDKVRVDSSGEVPHSDSDSKSDSESCYDFDSHNESNSWLEHFSEKLPSQPSKETSSEIPKDQTMLGRLLHRSQIQMYIQDVPTQQQRNVPQIKSKQTEQKKDL